MTAVYKVAELKPGKKEDLCKQTNSAGIRMGRYIIPRINLHFKLEADSKQNC